MTTLRIEVGRFRATAEEVADWIERAPGTRPNRLWVEIDPEAQAYVPIEEIQRELVARGIQVDIVPWPHPPPLPWWRYPLNWPRRVYYWARRVFLRETEIEQMAKLMYRDVDDVHDLSTRESPLLRKLQRPEESEDTERFMEDALGYGASHRDDDS